MSIRTKTRDGWMDVTQPWVKIGSRFEKAEMVYTKVGGVWREAWPLKPGPVRSLAVTTVYRNDRIEIDVDWLAPNTGWPVAQYIITVSIANAATGPVLHSVTSTVNPTPPAITLTNAKPGDPPGSGNGYHAYAGKKVYATVWAETAAGRLGDAVKSPAVTCHQLPPPAAPSSYTVQIDACRAHHSWSIGTGRTVTGVELLTQFNGVGSVIKRYPDSVNNAYYDSWDPNTINDGDVTCRCRTYGPGGESNWLTVTGIMPNPIKTSGYRFLDGKMKVDVSSIHPSVLVHYTDRNGPYVFDSERYDQAKTITIADSANWGRSDGRAWQMRLRPNNNQGWTGRDQYLGWLTKVAQPYYVNCTNSNTRRGGQWRSAMVEFQGASTGGLSTAYFFYDGAWFTDLSISTIGYRLHVDSAQIAMIREATGAGAIGAVRPRLMLHRAPHINGDLSHEGAYTTSSLSRGEAAWCTVPSDWAENLMQRENDYKGLGMHHSNTTLLSNIGDVSEEYLTVKAFGQGNLNGRPLFTVRVYHDG